MQIIRNTNKEKSTTTARKTWNALRGGLAVIAVLAMAGSASAKNNQNAGGASVDLSPDRTSATVTVSAQCDPATQGKNGPVSVYIFQSVGRLINIGVGSGTVLCTNAAIDQEITVNAIPGLGLQPGPATLLVRVTTVDPLTTQIGVSETGSRVNLHP